MTQYQPNKNATQSAVPTANKNAVGKATISALRTQVEQQSREIESLKKSVRRLQNEIRIAVNAFNLKNHG
jgi:polyhydroxyalkanoate synthesis regulator phasin